MKKLRKSICLLLVVSMLFGTNGVPVYAAKTGNEVSSEENTEETSGFDENAHGEVTKEGYCGGEYDAQYKLYEDGTLYIYGVRRNIVSCSKSLSLGVKDVYIEDGIEKIKNAVFRNFSSLVNIRIPDSVKSIEYECFSGCTSLEEIKFPESIKDIKDDMFFGCTSLKNVYVVGIIESIGDNAFEGCEKLESLDMLMTASSIGSRAFYGCNSLKKIIIPDNVEEVREKAFSNCSGIELVEVFGTSFTTYGYLHGSEFSECENLKIVILHDGSKNLDNVFYGCINLETIEIPNSVTMITDNTFYACGKLTIRCYEGSYAEEFAKENNIPVDLIHVHKYESLITKEPTCKETGIRTYTCSCGDEYTEEIPITEHNYDEEITKNPTCTENGTKTYICLNCNDSYEEEIPETGHYEIIAPAIEPTETEEGKTEGIHCGICGEVLKEQETIPITGKPEIPTKNTFNGCKGSPVKLSITCKESERFTFECLDNCGMQSKYTGYSSITSPWGSSYKKNYELIFSKSGEHIISVYKNGNLMENDKIIIVESHTWDSGKVDKKETCTENGNRTYSCTNCKNTKQELIRSTGHRYSKTITRNATCTENGFERYTCSKCRYSYTKSIPKTSHKYGNWKVIKKPTIFEKGKEKIVCTICRNTLKEKDIKKLKSSVKISKNKLNMKKGTVRQLKIKKKSKGDKIAKFTSSNKKIATVDRNGNVTAMKKGKTKITVKMKSGCKATCKVTVK